MSGLEKIGAFLASPIANWLGVSASEDTEGVLYKLTFHERHIGNPAIRAIHGGVVAGFLETAAKCALLQSADTRGPVSAVNMDIDYLLSTRPEDMYARAKIIRKGRRVAFVEAWCWQSDPKALSAMARFRLRVV